MNLPDPSPSQREEPPPSSAAPSVRGRRRASAIARLRRRAGVLLRLWRLYWLRAELRLAPTEAQRLMALTVIIGVACGLAAVAFHQAIELAQHLMIDRALSAAGYTWIGWSIATPAIGGVVCGALLHYVVPEARGSGIPQVKAAFARASGRVRLRDAVGKFALGTVQIGTGASLGREGPTVQICAGIASALGRLMGVSARSQRRLLPVGAAAGVAAAFNAPIAAVTFTVEEIVGDLDKSVLSGVIIAAAVAAVVERSVLGEHPVFATPQGLGLRHASSLLIYALLGLAASVVAVAFNDALLGLRARFRRLRAVPAWARPGVGGLVTGVLAVVALAWLRTRGVTGGGYDTLAQALHGDLAVRTMVALCAIKLVATAFSYGSGGAGGVFAPSLFIGGMLGGAFGALDVRIFGHEPDTMSSFALVGMGAAFAGIVRAPMTSVLIIVEMTAGYSLILPLMIANMTAYGLARRLRPTPLYDALLAQDGIALREKAVRDVLEGIRIADVYRRDADLVTFARTARAPDIAVATHIGQEVFPVVDAGAMLGIITTEEIDLLQSEPELELLVTATDVMRAPVWVTTGDDLHTALERMLAHHVAQLPVLDEGGSIVGYVDEAAIGKAYLRGHTARAD